MATKIGLIGCGRIARLKHLSILGDLPDVHVAALAELDAERRTDAMQRTPQATPYADYRDLLAQSEAEAVVICLPTPLHAEAAVAAFEAGKHVYLEKPIAANLEDARRILAAWKPSGRVGMMGFAFRHSPLYWKARRHVREGSLGRLMQVRSVFSAAVRALPAWKQKRSTGGGVLLDLASHHVDLLHYLFGQRVKEVTATLQSRRTEEDTAMLQMRLSSGLMAQSSFCMSTVNDHRFEIYGEKGRLTVDRYGAPDVEIARPSESQTRLKRLQCALDLRRLMHTPNYDLPFKNALQAFVEAAQTGRTASPDLMDGYRSLAVIAAAEESARAGQPVTLAEEDVSLDAAAAEQR